MSYHIIQSTDVTNGVINLTNNFSGHFQLEDFYFTNNLYNVTSYNNILPYQEGVTFVEIVLTEQFADGNDIATDIQTNINNVSGGTATVTYDANTNKFTITNDSTSFKLTFGNSIANTCEKLLGFSASNTTTALTTTSDGTTH